MNPIKLFGQSREDRNEWIEALMEASKTMKIYHYYKFDRIIGHGKFSKVYLSTDKQSADKVAIKVIEKDSLDENEKSFLGTELAIIKVISHPLIAELVDVFEDQQNLYIVMELVEGGELFDYIVKKMALVESEAAMIGYQILSTLDYLHECSIVHRDLKPENILVEMSDDKSKVEKVRITDFGLSKMMNPNNNIFEMCGTLAYVAPEVLMQEGYNKKVDTWAAGIIIYLLLAGTLPFDSQSKHEIFEKTVKADIDFGDDIW